MSVDLPEPEAKDEPRQIALRREALLPNERGRGLGTVAVVCTMAGVASGLALATTLMAMQVADSMAVRSVHVVSHVETTAVEVDGGYLGILYSSRHGVEIVRVKSGTPAEAVGLRRGDHVISINGDTITNEDVLTDRIYGSRPGSEITLVIERDGIEETMHPILVQCAADSDCTRAVLERARRGGS
jgi:S1-C subfamily serine protease